MFSQRSVLTALALVPVFALAAAGQDTGRGRTGSWGAWGGLAQNSPTNLWGAEGGRDIAILAVRRLQPLTEHSRFQWDYVLEVTPGAWVSMPIVMPAPQCEGPDPTLPCLNTAFEDSDVAHGFGIAPLGFQGRYRATTWMETYISGSGGMLRFSRPIPVDGGARLNLTAALGGGVFVRLPQRLSLELGYKFYHVSNGGMAARNPGLDGHLLVTGLQLNMR